MDSEIIPVLLTVTAASRDEQGRTEDAVQLRMPGTLEHRTDTWLLHYDETLEDDGDHTTVTHSVHLMIKPGHVTMLRKGPYSMMTVLEHGKRYEGVYHTPYGDMDMAIYTTRLFSVLGADHGTLKVEYQLDINGGFSSMRKMTLEYGTEERMKPC